MTATIDEEVATLRAEISAIQRRNVHRMGLEHADSIRVEKLESSASNSNRACPNRSASGRSAPCGSPTPGRWTSASRA